MRDCKCGRGDDGTEERVRVALQVYSGVNRFSMRYQVCRPM